MDRLWLYCRVLVLRGCCWCLGKTRRRKGSTKYLLCIAGRKVVGVVEEGLLGEQGPFSYCLVDRLIRVLTESLEHTVEYAFGT